jgi:hypothetical protein
MYTITPAVKANREARRFTDKKGNNIMNPISAPIGSAIPDRKETINALFLFFVA